VLAKPDKEYPSSNESGISRTGEKKSGRVIGPHFSAAPAGDDAKKRTVSPWREMATSRK
jgi:hypothetical protein